MTKLCPFRKAALDLSNYLIATDSPYNADNTGATNAATAINSCCMAAAAAGKGVYLPNGTYQITASLTPPSGLGIRGESKAGVIIDANNVTYPIRLNAKNSITFKNMTIACRYAQAKSGQFGVFFENTNYGHLFEDVVVSGAYHSGFQNSAGHQLYSTTWRRVSITDPGSFGIHCNDNGQNLTFEDVTIEDVHKTEDYPSHGFYMMGVEGFTFTRCEVSTVQDSGVNNDSGFGIYDCSDGTVTDCAAEYASYGFEIIAYGHEPEWGNHNIDFIRCGGANCDHAVWFQYGTSSDLTYTDCYGSGLPA